MQQDPALRGKCQYCGMDTPSTFDHYLPKGTFPDFSTMPINLVPCCFDCNIIKKESWLTVNNTRSVINVYYDVLPNDKYLNVTVNYSDDIPICNFRLTNPGRINIQMFTIIQSHFSVLDLERRYKEHTASVVSEMKRSIVIHNSPPICINNIRDWLFDEANSKRQVFGENYWEAALIEGLANSNSFLNECVSEINNKER